jgi:hypothetical protein
MGLPSRIDRCPAGPSRPADKPSCSLSRFAKFLFIIALPYSGRDCHTTKDKILIFDWRIEYAHKKTETYEQNRAFNLAAAVNGMQHDYKN